VGLGPDDDSLDDLIAADLDDVNVIAVGVGLPEILVSRDKLGGKLRGDDENK
jgi:hypothetical protein